MKTFHEARKKLVLTALDNVPGEFLQWVEDDYGRGLSVRVNAAFSDKFKKDMEDGRANKLYQCGFDMDELTVFCMARDEMEARGKYVESVREILDEAEEPGWEDAVWVEDLSDRVLL